MVSRLMPLSIRSYGLTDIGLVRQKNEDAFIDLNDSKLFILADGMGGHQAGDVAANEAVNALCQILKKGLKNADQSFLDSRQTIAQAMEVVNAIVYRMSRNNFDLSGMGTTLCCLHFHPEGAIIGHIGDSRVYRIHNQYLEQLTQDHSLLQQMLEQGREDELDEEPLANSILTRALGTEPTVEPTLLTCAPFPGDVFLLCSDGLSDFVTAREIESILVTAATPEERASRLIQAAKECGGYDNITVIVVEVKDVENLP